MNKYPKHWVSATINDTGEYINGFGFRQSHREQTGLPIIRIQNLTNPSAEFNFTTFLPDDKYLIKPGTLLVSWSATLDVFLWRGNEALLNQHIFKVVPNSETVDKGFLYFLLKKVIAELRESEVMRGTTMRHINRKPFLEYPIALPSLVEQRKIRDAIWVTFDRIGQVEGKLEKLLAQTLALKTAVFREAMNGSLTATWREEHSDIESAEKLLKRALDLRRFRWEERRRTTLIQAGRNVENELWKQKYPEPTLPDISQLPMLPDGWTWASLDQVTEIRSGLALNRQNIPVDGRIVPYLRVANVQRGRLDLNDVREITVSPKDLEDLRLEEGDILFNEGGDRDKLGRGWIWEGQLQDCIHQNHVFRARLVTDELEPRLISIWGNTFGQEYFERVAKQTTNLASISLSKLSQLPVPLPPYAEQQEILSKIEGMFDQADEQEKQIQNKLTMLNQLRQRILASAFSGQLKYSNVESMDAEGFFNIAPSNGKVDVAPSIKSSQRPMQNQSEKARLSLKEILADYPDGITPTELMQFSQYSARDADAFYEELFSLYVIDALEQVNRPEQFEPLLRIISSVTDVEILKAKDTPNAH